MAHVRKPVSFWMPSQRAPQKKALRRLCRRSSTREKSDLAKMDFCTQRPPWRLYYSVRQDMKGAQVLGATYCKGLHLYQHHFAVHFLTTTCYYSFVMHMRPSHWFPKAPSVGYAYLTILRKAQTKRRSVRHPKGAHSQVL